MAAQSFGAAPFFYVNAFPGERSAPGANGWEAAGLNCNCGYVLRRLCMSRCNTVNSIESRTSHGPYLLDHPGLAGVAGFAGGAGGRLCRS